MKEIKVIPLGGLGEVGMNCMILESDTEILMVDCGILFSHSPWMGFDFIIPSFEYIKKSSKKFLGLVITHGHEDHIGAIPFLCAQLSVPQIWASPFTSDIIRHKLRERGAFAPQVWNEVQEGAVYVAGDFHFEYVAITHSIVESFLIAFKTPLGIIVHSGDYKIDKNPYKKRYTNEKRLAEIALEKPLLLMSDSTNSEQVGRSLSDESLPENIKKAILETSGWAVFACFASHIERIQMAIDVAIQLGRKIYINGKSMQNYFQIALNRGHIRIDSSNMLTNDEMKLLNRNEVLIITSGTQGEFTSSMIRMALQEHLYVPLQAGDRIIFSALKIPGNEMNINFMFNQFAKIGVEVVHEKSAGLHVSGHGYQEDQQELVRLLKPKYFLPIHGELRMLKKHAEHVSANTDIEQSFVIENGHHLHITTGQCRIVSETNVASREWVSGKFRGDLQSVQLRHKKRAAREGILFISCLLQDFKLMASPIITLTAVLTDDGARESVQQRLVREVNKLVKEYQSTLVKSEDALREIIESSARKVCNRELGCKPLVLVHFL